MPDLAPSNVFRPIDEVFNEEEKRLFLGHSKSFRGGASKYGETPGVYARGLVYDRKLYYVHYTRLSTDRWHPVLREIFRREDSRILTVKIRQPFAESIWASSTYIGSGNSACVRLMDEPGPFPVVKLSHLTLEDNTDRNRMDESATRIEYEFQLLLEMQSFNLPVPKIDKQPLVLDGRICGFRMERLYPIPPDPSKPLKVLHPSDRFFHGETRTQAWLTRKEDAQSALERLHQAGYCHNDLGANHFMLDDNGRVTLIDLELGGRIGQPVPGWFHPHVRKEGPLFSAEFDQRVFAKQSAIEKRS